jgi:hypothetical protein
MGPDSSSDALEQRLRTGLEQLDAAAATRSIAGARKRAR